MASCGVCAVESPTLGGHLLWERNSCITAICEECWNNFSKIDSTKRVCNGAAQQVALKANIGVESQLYSRPMNPRKLFTENVKEALAKGHPIQRHPSFH